MFAKSDRVSVIVLFECAISNMNHVRKFKMNSNLSLDGTTVNYKLHIWFTIIDLHNYKIFINSISNTGRIHKLRVKKLDNFYINLLCLFMHGNHILLTSHSFDFEKLKYVVITSKIIISIYLKNCIEASMFIFYSHTFIFYKQRLKNISIIIEIHLNCVF